MSQPSFRLQRDKQGGIIIIFLCHSCSFLVIPVPAYVRINSSGNLRIYNILINFLIKHYTFNLYSICFCNSVLLDSRLHGNDKWVYQHPSASAKATAR